MLTTLGAEGQKGQGAEKERIFSLVQVFINTATYSAPVGRRKLRARQKIRCAFWRERRAGRCKAPRRRRCGGIVEERQRRRCPPAAAPLRAAARRPAGCVARSLHTAAGMLVARALPAGLGASSKMYTLFPDGPLAFTVLTGISIARRECRCVRFGA